MDGRNFIVAASSPTHPYAALSHFRRFTSHVCLPRDFFFATIAPCLFLGKVFGEERLKRGAYLAGLAEGPSVAQDLGLSPKDRLILVEGLDVKTLPFDRIGESKSDR